LGKGNTRNQTKPKNDPQIAQITQMMDRAEEPVLAPATLAQTKG